MSLASRHHYVAYNNTILAPTNNFGYAKLIHLTVKTHMTNGNTHSSTIHRIKAIYTQYISDPYQYPTRSGALCPLNASNISFPYIFIFILLSFLHFYFTLWFDFLLSR